VGHFISATAFQLAQDKGHSVLVRQTVQFLVEQGQQFATAFLRFNRGVWYVFHLLLLATSSGDSDSCFQSGTVGHAIQPATQRILSRNGPGFASEDEESRLKGVLGVVLVQQDTMADAHNHRAVPFEQCLEGVAIAMLDEQSKQLPIGQSATVL
jgi:hypothetical protein